MAVVIETTLGDITVDLFLDQRPVTCLNFLKLCKMKYYNFNLFHTIRSGFIAQTGDPTGEGSGGESVWGLLEGKKKRFFSGEKMPKIRHTDAGLLSMVCTDDMMVGSQFFFTLAPDLDSLDGLHCVIGEVTEGHEVLRKLNDVICDEAHRPYLDVRITHTVVLEDPFSDPAGLRAPSRSPSPNVERLKGGRIAPDEELDEAQGKSAAELQEMIEEKEAKARATILEIVGDLPDADIAPPENVLFVCKLNPVTTDEDLEIIFSRFGKIVSCEVIRDKKTGDSLQYAFIEFSDKKSCEDAYFKMDNVLIDDRRIHVDFSQSVSKIKWLGKGRGVKYMDEEDGGKNKSRFDYKNIDDCRDRREISDYKDNRDRKSKYSSRSADDNEVKHKDNPDDRKKRQSDRDHRHRNRDYKDREFTDKHRSRENLDKERDNRDKDKNRKNIDRERDREHRNKEQTDRDRKHDRSDGHSEHGRKTSKTEKTSRNESSDGNERSLKMQYDDDKKSTNNEKDNRKSRLSPSNHEIVDTSTPPKTYKKNVDDKNYKTDCQYIAKSKQKERSRSPLEKDSIGSRKGRQSENYGSSPEYDDKLEFKRSNSSEHLEKSCRIENQHDRENRTEIKSSRRSVEQRNSPIERKSRKDELKDRDVHNIKSDIKSSKKLERSQSPVYRKERSRDIDNKIDRNKSVGNSNSRSQNKGHGQIVDGNNKEKSNSKDSYSGSERNKKGEDHSREKKYCKENNTQKEKNINKESRHRNTSPVDSRGRKHYRDDRNRDNLNDESHHRNISPVNNREISYHRKGYGEQERNRSDHHRINKSPVDNKDRKYYGEKQDEIERNVNDIHHNRNKGPISNYRGEILVEKRRQSPVDNKNRNYRDNTNERNTNEQRYNSVDRKKSPEHRRHKDHNSEDEEKQKSKDKNILQRNDPEKSRKEQRNDDSEVNRKKLNRDLSTKNRSKKTDSKDIDDCHLKDNKESDSKLQSPNPSSNKAKNKGEDKKEKLKSKAGKKKRIVKKKRKVSTSSDSDNDSSDSSSSSSSSSTDSDRKRKSKNRRKRRHSTSSSSSSDSSSSSSSHSSSDSSSSSSDESNKKRRKKKTVKKKSSSKKKS